QGASEAGSQIFQYAMEEVIIPKAKTVFKEVTANLKKQAAQEVKAAIKNVSKIVSAAKANSKNMFGGLKNSAPKVPSSLPSGNIS
ncbi:MAG: hypothetical protein E6942_16870, partial [Clostridium argentinense]|nr:hypothetical protein [Clostridium argentinense]